MREPSFFPAELLVLFLSAASPAPCSLLCIWECRVQCGVNISKLLQGLFGFYFSLRSALPLFETSLSCFLSRA